MKATELFREKHKLPDGGIVEMIIWRLPRANSERPHGLKYRLFYGKDGQRLVGYDNEQGKADHKHILSQEYPYKFVSVQQLIADFLADVERVRGRN